MSDPLLHLDDASFPAAVLDQTGPVLVDAYAEWCGPCKALSPTIEALARDLEGQATVAKLDIDRAPEVTATYGITSVPTVLVFEDGQLRQTLVGLRPRAEYENALGLLGD